MSKPDWKDAPEWAQFVAMDEDGYWCWHENEPDWVGDEWASVTGRVLVTGRTVAKDSLEPRP